MDLIKDIKHKHMFTWKFFSRISVLILLAGFIVPTNLSATHIVGGDLTFRCLGNNRYEIRLTMRRDCLLGAEDAPFDNPAGVGFFDAVTNQLIPIGGVGGYLPMFLNENDTLNQTFISDCTIAGNDVCVEQTVYVDTVTLPFRPNGYIMAYQRCCRNGTLANVANPLHTGMTLTAYLSPQEMTDCGNGPQFGPYPPIYICANEPFTFNHSATDDEGDSLVYSLCTPLAGGDQDFNMPQPPPNPPYDTVVWQPPYGPQNLLGGEPLTIDPHTGVINAVPNVVGQFIVGIRVDSYRDGVLVGYKKRDFQVNVRMCRDVPVADFSTEQDLYCDTLTVEFFNSSLFSDEYRWIFDYGNPGSDISNELEPTYTFPGPGFYDVALITNDIDSICFDTLIQTVGVFESELAADFILEIPTCTEEIVISPIDQSSDPDYEIVSWDWILTCDQDTQVSAEQFPVFTLEGDPDDCNLCLTVTDENGCTAVSCQAFDPHLIDIGFLSDSLFVCDGESTEIVTSVDTTVQYIWGDDPGLDLTDPLNPVVTPTISTTYRVTVTDGICTVEDSIYVGVGLRPEAAFSFDIPACQEEIVIMAMDASTSPEGYAIESWDWILTCGLDIQVSSAQNPTFNVTEEPDDCTLCLTVTDENGCSSMTCQTFSPKIIDISFFADSLFVCNGESTEIIAFVDPDLEYTWGDDPTLDLSEPINPIATPTVPTTYYVTVTDGICVVEDSIFVGVQLRPDIDFSVFTDCRSLTITTENLSEGGLFIWDFGDPDTEDDISFDKEPTYTYANPGVYTVTLQTNDGCDTSATREITVSAIQEIVDDVQLGCVNEPVFLNPDFNPGYSYAWSPEDLLEDPNDPNPLVILDQDTTFYVTITDNAFPGCSILDTVQVSYPMVSVSDMLEDTVISCFMEPVPLNPDFNPIWTYEWEPVEGLSDPMIGNPIATVNGSTVFYLTITDNIPPNCTVEDSILVFVPEDFEILLQEDTVYCGVQTITVTAGATIDGISFEWFDENGNSIGTGASIDLSPSEQTSYMVTGTDPYGCSKDASITLTPTFFNLTYSNDEGICVGDEVELSVTNNDPNQDLTYSWTPTDGILTNPDSSIIIVSPSNTTTYMVTVENGEVGCIEEMTIMVTVFVFDPPDVMIDIVSGSDSVIVGVDEVQLEVNQDPSWMYEWTSTPPDDIDNVFNPIVTPPAGGAYTYTVTVTNDGSCTAVASIGINAFDPPCNEEDIFLPNAFSPNDDGENDVLFIRGNFILDVELRIYNRWGQEVFFTNDQNMGWDGTFNGEQLTPDVFGYYLSVGCPGDKRYQTQGNITLFR